jgi:uncharacterized protein YndB with AHSA1/START domain
MPKVSRTRVIDATSDRVWDLVRDPHNLPRWWPRTKRVEDVSGDGARTRWTAVLETERGSGVRADFRSTASTNGERFAWEQVLDGTPFERILRASKTEIKIRPDGGRSKVELISDESLKGMSRLGSGMIRSASKRRLDEALDGIELAVGAR